MFIALFSLIARIEIITNCGLRDLYIFGLHEYLKISFAADALFYAIDFLRNQIFGRIFISKYVCSKRIEYFIWRLLH